MFKKEWVAPAVAGVCIWAVLGMLGTSVFLALGVGVVVGVALAAIMIARSRGEKPMEVVEEVVQQVVNPDPDAIKRLVHEKLTLLNESIRIAGVSLPIITASEALIDLLYEVVPRALQEAPDTETAFNLEKLCTDHVPELLQNYMKLSAEDQASSEASTIRQLTDLTVSVTAAKDALDAGNMDEFALSSEFINAKMA